MTDTLNLMIPPRTFVEGIHIYQEDVLDVFADNIQLENGIGFNDVGIRYFMLEWHRRARKTTLAINIIVMEAFRVPDAKYVYIAPYLKEAKEIVWSNNDMLFGALPPQFIDTGDGRKICTWKKNESSLQITINENFAAFHRYATYYASHQNEISEERYSIEAKKLLTQALKFKNGTIIVIYGADNYESIRGAETVGVVFDEWALINLEVWSAIFQPIFIGNLTKEKAALTHRWAMFLYTPKGDNHATNMFNVNSCIGSGGELPSVGRAKMFEKGWYTSRLDAEKSNILNAERLADLQRDIKNGILLQAIYNQEYKCARITEEERSIITSAALDKLQKVNRLETTTRKFISCDPSLGGDECVVYVWENSKIIDAMYIHERNQKIVTSEIEILGFKYGIKTYVGDEIGIGIEICSRLRELEWNVFGFCSSASANDNDRFENLKAEAWWQARSKVMALEVVYPQDDMLRKQIASVKFTITMKGKIACEKKDLTKKRIGCSPDRADAWVMGLWVMPKVEPIKDSGNNVRQSGVIRPSYTC
jgi:hypothetical protein